MAAIAMPLVSITTSLDAVSAQAAARRRDEAPGPASVADTASFSKHTSACSNGIPADRPNGLTVEAAPMFAKREVAGSPDQT